MPHNNKLQDIYYVIPRIACVSLAAPINIVQGIYAKHYGLTLTTIASVILFVRLFDAITDPLVGYFSDLARIKSGTRKPYIVAGAFVMVTSGYFLYSPPSDVDVFYFGFWFMAFFIGFTLFEIPHLAWGGEISLGSLAKTKTYSLRTAAGFSGLVLFYSIPLLPIWESKDITPQTLEFSAVASGLLMLPLLYFCITRVPNGASLHQVTPRKKRGHLYKELIYITKNKPLLLFLSAFVFAGLGLGMWYGLIFIYVDAYLLKGHWFAEIYLISFIAGVAFTIAWIKVAAMIGKKLAWIFAMILGVMSFVATFYIEPSNVTYFALLMLLLVNTLCFTCVESLPQSMLSEIVDYSTLRFGTYRGSTFFSLYIFTYKAVFAVGGAVGLAITGWHDFDPASATHTERGISGLITAMQSIPVVLSLVAIFFIALSPITLKRHEIIRRRLQRLGERGSSDQSLALT